LSSVASYKGSAGLVLAKNIDGEFVLESSGYSGGSIDLIYADNIAGNQILQKCGYTGNVKELLVSNIVEDPVKERITNLESMNVSTLIQDSSRNHEHFVKKYSLDKIAEIAELMYGKSPDELIKGANLIKKIYEQTKIEMKKPSSRRVYETIKTKKRDYDKIKSMFNQLVDLLKPRK